MKKANIAAAIAGMGVSAAAFIVTLGFKQFKNVPVGPEFFPRWMAAGLFVCSLGLLVQSVKAKSSGGPSPTLSPFDQGMRRLLIGAAIIVVYGISWDFLGFIAATPPGLFALMALLGLRNLRKMIIFSLSAMIVIFCAFRYLLGINMPMGFLEGLF
jgi:putative tricarboxylic transport membrane protein